MAYLASGLVRIADGGAAGTAPGNRRGIHHYATADTFTAVAAANYFNGAKDFLKVGDLVLLTYGVGGTVGVAEFVVLTNDGTNVTMKVEQAALFASAVLDFPSIAAVNQQELTIAVTGAAVGDGVAMAPPASLNAILVAYAYVSSADTVTIRLVNPTAGALDPAPATWGVHVFKR